VAAKSWRRAARRDAIASRPSKSGQEYPREARLVQKAQFDAVYRAGKRRSSSHFTAFVKANDLPQSRFGFSIKKALGGAVVRNRIRRRLREIARLHREEIPAGWDIVIHPKSSVAKVPFEALTADFFRLLKL
jgi:ribonuclease P protein component